MRLLLIGGKRSGEYIDAHYPPLGGIQIAHPLEPMTTPFSNANADFKEGYYSYDEYDLIQLQHGFRRFNVYTLRGMTGAEVMREYHKVTDS